MFLFLCIKYFIKKLFRTYQHLKCSLCVTVTVCCLSILLQNNVIEKNNNCLLLYYLLIVDIFGLFFLLLLFLCSHCFPFSIIVNPNSNSILFLSHHFLVRFRLKILIYLNFQLKDCSDVLYSTCK